MQPPGHNAHPAAWCQTTACGRQAGATERGGEAVSLSAADAAQEEGTKTPAESQTTSLLAAGQITTRGNWIYEVN